MQMLVDEILNKNTHALARSISAIEKGGEEKRKIIKEIYRHTGKAYVVGITGPPGVGKSTLVNSLTKVIRQCGLTVGIIAVDPTSPFSGGALLGDRIRMQEHLMDEGVFIRSMGTRGSMGGLARATKDTIKLLDAFGLDIVLVETVGVGQSELDIMYAVDSTVVTLAPGAGDTIQTLKAGIMEIADIFTVNKADLGGAQKVVQEVENMLELNHSKDWQIPVLMTTATELEGFEDLYKVINKHRNFLQENDLLQTKRRMGMRNEIIDIVLHTVKNRITSNWQEIEEYEELMLQVAERRCDTYDAADKILHKIVL